MAQHTNTDFEQRINDLRTKFTALSPDKHPSSLIECIQEDDIDELETLKQLAQTQHEEMKIPLVPDDESSANEDTNHTTNPKYSRSKPIPINNCPQDANETTSSKYCNFMRLCQESPVHACPQDANSCVCVKRVLLILEFHSFNCQTQLEQSTLHISDIIDNLPNYSRHSMLCDMQHVKSNHSPDIQCDGNDCVIFKRNCRRRNYREHSLQSASSFIERFTISILDKYHSSFCHSNQRTFSSLTMDRFTTHCQEQQDSQHNDDHHEDSKSCEKATELPHYLFGQPLCYHNEKDSTRNTMSMTFVTPIHADLKTELLQNKHYSIDKEDYESYQFEAKEFQKSDNAKKARRRAKPLGFALHIKPNDILSTNHFICILSYCNDNTLQQMFTQNCRNQNIDALVKNNQHIANWCRLLRETILIFGEPLKETITVYRGISTTFILSQIKASFWAPTSTTTNFMIAKNFIDDGNDGMILSLCNERVRGGTHFDCEWISQFPEEKEKLFYGVALIINEVMLTGINRIGADKLSVYIESIQLFQAIITGRPFRTKPIFRPSIQHMLIRMIQCYLKNGDDIPSYPRLCFEASVQSTVINKKNAAIFILKSHWCALQSKLLNYFVDFGRNRLGAFLQKTVNIKNRTQNEYLPIFFLQEIQWKVSHAEISNLVQAKPGESARRLGKAFEINCGLKNTERIILMLCYSIEDNNIKLEVPLRGDNKPLEFRNKYVSLDKMIFDGYVHIEDGPKSFLNLGLEMNGQHDFFTEWLFDVKIDVSHWLQYDHIEMNIALCCTHTGYKDILFPNTEIFDENIPGMTLFQQKKERGNDLYRSNRFTEALKYYTEAVDALECMKTLKKGMFVKLVTTILNNKAMVLLKRQGAGDYDICILLCTKILQRFDTFNQKATWRLARALTLKRKLAEARKVCTEYLKYNENDVAMQKMLKSIQ
eukprot:221508_1